MIASAELVLTAAREHRAAVVRLVPAAQAYTFTLSQAARIANWRTQLADGQPLEGWPPAEAGALARLRALVRELDAGRGRAPLPAAEDGDDVPDPHEGVAPHAPTMQGIVEAVAAIAVLAAAAGSPATVPAG